MATSLFIYYKVATCDLAQAEQAARRLVLWSQGRGIQAQLMRRQDTEGSGLATLMEIYKAVPDGFQVQLEQQLATSGVTPLSSSRAVEVFESVDSTEW